MLNLTKNRRNPAYLISTAITMPIMLCASPALAQTAPDASGVVAAPGRPGAADQPTESPAVPAGAPSQPAATSGSPSGGGLQEIVVTANRRSEAAQKTPLAITAISGSQLAAKGVVETADLAIAVPNLQIISPYGKAQPNISLRGISVANEYNANQASPIGVYIDDAYMSSRTSHGLQLYDLERVEVLRGPQGTLYGRNTTGGAVNFITVKPKLDQNSGYIDVGYGNENQREANGALNVVLVPDHLAIRVAGTYTKSDGFVKNFYPGVGNAQSEDNLGGRLELLWKPDTKLTVLLKGYYGRDRPRAGGVNGIGATPDGTNPVSGYNRGNLGIYQIDTDYIGLYKFDTEGTLLNIGYQFNDALSITSLTSYDTGGRRIDQNADESPLDVLRIVNRDRFEQVNQEVRVNYDKNGLKAVVGGYFGWDRVNVDSSFNFFQFLQSEVPFNPPNSPFGLQNLYDQTRRSRAIFGQADYAITSKLSLTVGLRYTWDTLTYFNGKSYITDYSGNPVAYTIPTSEPYDPNTPGLRMEKSFKALSGKAGINYQFDRNVLGYISYSRGYRAGAVNGAGDLSPAQVTFVQPETVDAYEIGLKSEFLNHHFRANLAGFYYNYKNQQLDEVIGAVSFLRNAPKAIIYGAEAELTAVLSDRLTLNSAVGLLHTEYKELELSGENLDGNRIPFAPNITVNGGAQYLLAKFQDGGKVSVNGNFGYTGQQFFSPFNNGPSYVGDPLGNFREQQKGYVLVNGKLGYEGPRFYGSIWAKNIFDKGYYVFGLDVRESFGYDYLAVGAPRSFGGTIGYKF